jgi:hypothetical protein
MLKMRCMDLRNISLPKQRIRLCESLVAAHAHIAAGLAVAMTVIGHQLLCQLMADRTGARVAR